MGGAVFLPCWLFAPRRPSTGAYRLFGGVRSWLENGSLQEGSRQWVLPELPPPVSHTVSHSHSPASAGDPAILAGKSGPNLLRGHCFLPQVLVGMRSCECPPRVEFLFLSVLWNSCEFLWSNLAGLQSQILWGLFLSLPDPQAGNPDMVLRTLTAVGELMWYYFSSLWVTHLACTGFDFITIALLLPSHCGFFFVFACRVSFLVGSSIFLVNGSLAVICDFHVSVRRGELPSFYSTILSVWKSRFRWDYIDSDFKKVYCENSRIVTKINFM